MKCTSPQSVFDHIIPSLQSKIPRTRASAVTSFEQTINSFGKDALKISPMMPQLFNLVNDKDKDVRYLLHRPGLYSNCGYRPEKLL